VNGDGVITCEEFTKVFLHMGFVEREKELKEAIEKQKRAEARRLQAEEEKRLALENKNSLKVSFTFTEEEMQSAMRKLTEAAWRYDKLMPGAPCLDAFESQYMEPVVLKEQLKKGFYMNVTPQELGAIVHYFDSTGSGKIDCEQFLKKFIKTGYDERQRQKVEWREHQRVITEAAQRKKQIKQKEKDDKIAFADLDHKYTEADFQTAFEKLTTGAMKYDRSGPGAVGLDAFEAVSMPPHVFKEQLKLVFNVNVTLPELWALVAYFDRDNTGVVNCKHFLTQFLRTGLDERIRIRQGWRKEEILKREKDKQLEEAKEAEKAKRAWAEVDFDFLEPDFDAMLAKLVDMCFNFDRRQLGPAGLSGFEVDSLNPSEFREMLRRTFNLKLTSRELGAMVTYFDSRGKKVADCAMFLNSVVQIRVQCEEFKVSL
jgi:Ca2+-binding EF-hand superfamily protein